MRLGFFVWSMAKGYSAFLTPGEADWLLSKLPWISDDEPTDAAEPKAATATM
jgi:hypothetical protein